jgi:hypothetical protein
MPVALSGLLFDSSMNCLDVVRPSKVLFDAEVLAGFLGTSHWQDASGARE